MVIGMRYPHYRGRMSPTRFLLLCSIGCLLVMTSGCAWAAGTLWGYTLENHSAETFLNVEVARAGKLRPLGPGSYVFPSGAGGGDLVGVIGQMPKAVTITFASKDKRQHRIYVLIPPRPGGYGSESPHIYFVVLSRCKAIATWKDPEDRGWRRWYYTVRNHSADKVSALKAAYRNRTSLLTSGGLNPDRLATWLATDNLATNPMPEAVEVVLISPDGTQHTVRVALPAAAHTGAPWPRVHLLVHSNGSVTAKCTYPDAIKPPQRWFCAVGDNGKPAFSNLKVTANGKSYPLGGIGPKSDASLSALGPMPKALQIRFTSPDGKRHKVRVQAAAASTFHGTKTPELYMLIGNHAKLIASWICPQLLKYKPPPHWTCSILDTDPGVISHVTMACDGKPPFTAYDVLGGPNSSGGTMNPKGLAPKVIDFGFTTADGKRHTMHLILPAFHGSGQPSFTLTIEKGGKVVATSP